jgi:hypothetical protein
VPDVIGETTSDAHEAIVPELPRFVAQPAYRAAADQ